MEQVQKTSISKQAHAKKPWHRPHLTFVELTATASGFGSPTDGTNTGSTGK